IKKIRIKKKNSKNRADKMIIGTGNGMNIKKSKQPSKHLKLLKPNRFGKDRTEQKLQNFQKHLKKLGAPSDFNIPKELVSHLGKRIQKAGSLRLLLNQCIHKRPFLILVPKQTSRNKISYQEQKLELQRYSFRPFEDDWIELKRLSFLYGVSMCKMFVKLLLETDLYPESRYAENPILDKLEGDTGDPTLIQKTGS
ncbi:PF07600 family protein, partial [Leptospira interrogans serovar Icterohaemorrhagiae str. Verdun HP]